MALKDIRDRSRGRFCDHPLFFTWRSMIGRCSCKSASNYDRYGGRGIEVCARWKKSLWNFVDDMGTKPSRKHSLHRVNNDGNYEPNNVLWATRREQMSATGFNRMITANGKAQTLREWSRETGLAWTTLFNRMERGWSDEAMVLTPKLSKGARLGFARQVKRRFVRKTHKSRSHQWLI